MNKSFCFAVSLLTFLFSYAQHPAVGIWEGKLNAGVELRIIFHIKDSSGTLFASMDIPEQGIRNSKVSSIEYINDSIKLNLAQYQARYIGRMVTDTLISGRWQQGLSTPLVLKK